MNSFIFLKHSELEGTCNCPSSSFYERQQLEKEICVRFPVESHQIHTVVDVISLHQQTRRIGMVSSPKFSSHPSPHSPQHKYTLESAKKISTWLECFQHSPMSTHSVVLPSVTQRTSPQWMVLQRELVFLRLYLHGTRRN